MTAEPRVGVVLNHEEDPGEPVARWRDVCEFAEVAEAAGLSHLWVVDHFGWDGDPFGRPSPASSSYLGVWEGWTMLSALAARTTRIGLGTLVSCTRYRNPALLAKMADTVDEISGGRLILGLGAGDSDEEHAAFGYQFDRPVGHFAEALTIITRLLRTGAVDFDGVYYQAHAQLRPRGPSPAGPTILIGSLGHGPRVLALVARYADMWNGWITSRSSAGIIAPIRDAVDAACHAARRDPATLRRSVTVAVAFDGPMIDRPGTIAGTDEAIAAELRAFHHEGIDDLQVRLFPNTAASVERLARILVSASFPLDTRQKRVDGPSRIGQSATNGGPYPSLLLGDCVASAQARKNSARSLGVRSCVS
jgi:alkanesulfonate monooxygenase SsuD/methylene tetrahydromethanopterin reductase-like flavin-dependent oxidoreductase (luciferase family)